MKLWRILRLVPLAMALLALLTLGLMLPGCETDEAADEVGNELPEGIAEAPPGTSSAFGGFYRVSPELEAELEQIVLADPRVQALLEGKDYSFTVDGHTIEGQDYNLAVGVRLKDEVTSEELTDWMIGGSQDPSLIKDYVGVLDIGRYDKYYLTIDREEGQLVEILHEAKDGVIPEVTGEEKQRAVEIALADPVVQQLISGKEYEIAPEGRIGVWHSGSTKLGVVFDIEFDKPYFFDIYLPQHQIEPQHFSGEVQCFMILVHLEENRVVTITPSPPITMD